MSFEHLCISPETLLFDVLKIMDKEDVKLLMIREEKQFVSIVSIGDVQRAILQNIDLQSQVKGILRTNITVAHVSDQIDSWKKIILEKRLEYLPFINDDREIVDVVFWKDLTTEVREASNKLKDIPVVIMAGGQGSRLRPITNIIPKALVPLGEKPIIQLIIERFISFGCRTFFISVNYKGEMIEDYLNKQGLDCEFHFYSEDQPMGTSGSLSLIKDYIKGSFFVSNCDILIDQDFAEVFDYHKQYNNTMTAIAAMKHFQIHYGIMEVKENGHLSAIQEKPSYHFRVNAGVYVMEPEVFNFIPENEFHNINVLMEDLMEKDKNIGVFPVTEGAWMDIGVWSEYQKTNEIFNRRKS
ncbi:MAG: nucleotidyltransferase family protein [Flavobacteriales bacterium]